jgi:ribonucleoside-diphosphate reductase alpha chain
MILPLIPQHRPVLRSLGEGGSLGTFFASNIENATIDVKKEQRGVMATATAARESGPHSLRVGGYSDAEKNACSIDAMMNGGTCEACQ